MAGKYKTSYRGYAAWNYREEIEDLNRLSAEGWQLIKGGCFHSRFVKNPDIQYRYQLDFQKVEDMGRYIETFREQGWEYVSSTWNGWHYFRKLYDPSLPDEEYEIFTDRESLQDMNRRWARIAGIVGGCTAGFALLSLIRMLRMPNWPHLMLLLLFGVESAVLLWGASIMHRSEEKREGYSGKHFLALFMGALLILYGAYMVLSTMRPHFQTGQNAAELTEPRTDNRWISFQVKYPDYYYLDVDMKGDSLFSLALVDENGKVWHRESGAEVHKKNIPVKLPKGEYWLALSAENGFAVECTLD